MTTPDEQQEESRVIGLWRELGGLMLNPPAGESAQDRLATPPWESDDLLIRAIWGKLTAPEHELELAALAAQPDLNPTAREYFIRAVEDARARRDEL